MNETYKSFRLGALPKLSVFRTHGREDGAECGGALLPIAIWVKSDDELRIIQRCRLCGEMTVSPLHKDDSPIKVLSVAARPLSSPAFPIERVEEMTKMMGGRGDVKSYYNEPRE